MKTPETTETTQVSVTQLFILVEYSSQNDYIKKIPWENTSLMKKFYENYILNHPSIYKSSFMILQTTSGRHRGNKRYDLCCRN